MIVGDVFNAEIQSIGFRKNERKQIGTAYGIYESNYVATLAGYTNAIVVIDSLAQGRHPNWGKKTSNRAEILAKELVGSTISVKVIEIIRDGVFEAELV